MKLRQIIAPLGKVEVVGSLDKEVTGVAYDSRCVTPGKLFVAIRGVETDGHHFIGAVAEKGAVAVVCEQKGASGGKMTRVIVQDSRKALPLIAAAFYKNPADQLWMIGVTGTNGKTTVTFLIKRILEAAGIHTGLLGTIRYEIGDRIIPAQRTTPESLDLHEMLSKVVAANEKCCVMEVSSHALQQGRVKGINYRTGVFTNLTRDHLDYHGTMQSYFESKKRLFTDGAAACKDFCGVVNVDDPFGRELLEVLKDRRVISYGLKEKAVLNAEDIQFFPDHTEMKICAPEGVFPLKTPLIGRYNISNVLAAIGAGMSLNVELKTILAALEDVPPVPGRLERVDAGQNFNVLVDYAHTDDAMFNVLSTLREITKGRVLLAFGCGGSRDKGKRVKMGEVAAKLADYTVITTDNPRKEEPAEIAAQVEAGYVTVRQDGYELELDRSLAIERIIRMAKEGDSVLLCGKGHETYQEFNGLVVPFDDRLHAMNVLDNLLYRTK